MPPPGLMLAAAISAGHLTLARVPDSAAALAGAAALGTLPWWTRRHALRVLGVLWLGAAVGVLRGNPPEPALPTADTLLAGRITAWDPGEQGVTVALEVHRVGTRRISPPRNVRLYAPATWPISPVSRWLRVSARLRSARGATVPGGYASPLAGTATCARDGRPEWGPGSAPVTLRLRAALRETIHHRWPGFPGRLAEAVLLGRSRALTAEELEAFRLSGTAHLVAVSGLHVGLVAMAVFLLGANLPVPLRAAATVAGCWAYALLAGAPPSALRAALLVSMIQAGALGQRRRPPEHWLALVLAWLLAFDPHLISTLSFRLSVGAVAGILVAVDLLSLRSAPRWLAASGVSLGAQWGTLPWSLSAFATVAPLALAPNLVAVPLTGLFLPGVLVVLAAGNLPGVGAEWTEAVRRVGEAIGAVLRWSAATLPVWRDQPPVHGSIPWLFFLGSFVWLSLPAPLRSRSRGRALAGGAAVVLVLSCWLPVRPAPGPWVAFLDIGQGDAAVARLSDGTVWVVDLGDDRGPGDGATRGVLPFLRAAGLRRVDGLILSHRHRDHVGGLDSFLSRVKVEHIFDAGYGGRRGTPAVVDSVLQRHQRVAGLAAAGDTLHAFAGGALVAVHPPRGDPREPLAGAGLNDASLVVRLVDGKFSVLFAGDAEHWAESVCLAGGTDLGARVLKVGHHGSRTSSTPAFVSQVDPELAVISAGENNRFGHPAPETLLLLEGRGTPVLRTDRHGTVWVDLQDDRLRWRSYPPRRRSW